MDRASVDVRCFPIIEHKGGVILKFLSNHKFVFNAVTCDV
jgi:hypothetical protein